jgi:hypothetical protein
MKDKLKHFLVCGIVSILTLGVLLLLGTNWSGYEKLLALSFGVGAALAKEMIWDKWLHLGTPEFYDFVAGLFGAFAGTFIWIIIETIILEICH